MMPVYRQQVKSEKILGELSHSGRVAYHAIGAKLPQQAFDELHLFQNDQTFSFLSQVQGSL
jgi:hypothetical protein